MKVQFDSSLIYLGLPSELAQVNLTCTEGFNLLVEQTLLSVPSYANTIVPLSIKIV